MTEQLQVHHASPLPPAVDQPRRLDALALTAFVVAFFASAVGLVLGHVALRRIDRTGDAGRGLALAAVVLGWIGTLGSLLLVVALVVGSWVFRIF